MAIESLVSVTVCPADTVASTGRTKSLFQAGTEENVIISYSAIDVCTSVKLMSLESKHNWPENVRC